MPHGTVLLIDITLYLHFVTTLSASSVHVAAFILLFVLACVLKLTLIYTFYAIDVQKIEFRPSSKNQNVFKIHN